MANRFGAVVVGALVAIALGCGSGSTQSKGSYENGVDALTDDNGTRISASPTGAVECSSDGASLGVAGEVVTTGSVDSVEITAEVDGGDATLIGTIPPQAFVHDGREKRATFSAQVGLANGTHAVSICLTQSGAQGRTPKRTCADAFTAIAACSVEESPAADTLPPVSAATPAPAANVYGWNRTDVTVTITASDEEGGSGVKQISYSLSGAQVGAGQAAGSSAPVVISAEGETELTFFAEDAAGNLEAPHSLTIRIDETNPTVAFASASPAANGAGWNNTPVAIAFEVSDDRSGVLSSSPASPVAFTTEGAAQTAQVTAEDRAGNVTVASSPAVNLDWTPPELTGIPESCVLWPPNHKYQTVAVIGAEDALSGVTAFSVEGQSSEPDNALGDGNTTSDIAIDGGTVQVRAERSGTGEGRSYTITAHSTDAASNETSATFVCAVPHDQRGR